jgi:hypothetical protein
MQAPFTGGFPNRNLQHGCARNAISIGQSSQERLWLLQKDAGLLNVFSTETVPHIAVQVNMRTGGASSPLIYQGAFALAPGKEGCALSAYSDTFQGV